MRGVSSVAIVLGLTALPFAAAAQRLIVTPTFGMFVSLRDQSRWSWTDCCITGTDFTETLRTELSTATTVGMKVEVGLGERLGLEASFANASTGRRIEWSASDVPNPPPPDVLIGPSHTAVTSLRVRFRKSLGAQAVISAGVGPSLVSLSREAWCGDALPCIQDLTTFGPTLDLALGYTVRRRARFEIGVVNNIYSVRYAEPPFPGREVEPEQSRFWQHDVMISVGFGLVL